MKKKCFGNRLLISFLNCEADISDDFLGKEIRRIPKSELIAVIHPILELNV